MEIDWLISTGREGCSQIWSLHIALRHAFEVRMCKGILS